MASTEYSRPTISSEPGRPIPMANQGYPYNSIASDRRFEELVYSIHKKKVENEKTWKELYDDIALMQGVGEKGRDCVLYKDGIIKGLIQCKKYENRISKPDCLKEILKFVLYSFFDPLVLPDPNHFTYYFVVSEGFSGPAADYLDKFNDEIIKEPELENWFNELKSKYNASLGSLDYKTIYADLLKKLAAIKVRKVVPQDLDIELSAPYCQSIIPIFFEVRTVTDNSRIDQLINLIETRLVAPNDLQVTEQSILRQFETASLQLSSYRGDLYNVKDSHIDRHETKEVIDWIGRALKPDEEPVLIVAGNPGYGKTVILKDVLSSLNESKTPAIAIKADRYYANSLQDLAEKLNLEHPLIQLVQKLRETNDKVVLIIDQLDSLSQSITTRRDYIDTYNQLIHQLKHINGIRIVISIRTFDLNYDFEFSKYKDRQKVIVKPLSDDQVKKVLAKLGLYSDKVSNGFIQLLSIPNHLDIFCKIYGPGVTIDQLHSLQDLYNELWKQKITSQAPERAEQYTKVAFEIADKMYSLQQLSIPESQLTESIKKDLPYLTSNGLVEETSQSLQFFHQSFYDYVFAKSFTAKGGSLKDYIVKEEQSIYIRPAVKMILSFLRQKDITSYMKLVSSLLSSGKIRYHLQLLVINHLGFEENPVRTEINFVKKKLLPSSKWELPFLESAIGLNWLPVLIETGMLDHLLNPAQTIGEHISGNNVVQAVAGKLGLSPYIDAGAYEKRKEKLLNLWYWILRRSLPENRVAVVGYLQTVPLSDEKNSSVLRLLNSMKKWDYPVAFSLFESCTPEPEKNWFDILNILEDTLEYNFDWTLNQIDRFLVIEADRSEGRSSSMYDHQMGNCLKKMFRLDGAKSFSYTIEFIGKLIAANIEKIEIDTSVFYYDGAYDLYDFDRDHTHNTKELCLQLVLDSVATLAKEKSPAFEKFIAENKGQKSLTILKILLVGLVAAPKEYSLISFETLKRLLTEKAYDHGLQYWIGKLISADYVFLNADQKAELNSMLLTLRSQYDFHIQENGTTKAFFSYFGKTRYELLSMIPEQEIMKVPKLKRHFQELQRKFGKPENRKPQSVRMYRIGPPLLDKAYDKMDHVQWENSFLQFDTDKRPDWGSDRGGLTENYRKFEAKIPENVAFFLPLIEKIIREKKVVPDYMLAGLKGLVDANYDPEKFQPLFKEMTRMPLAGFHVRQLVWLADYIIKNKLVDEELVSYLCKVAAEDPNPEKPTNPDNPEFDMLNTNRGAAVHALVRCFTHKEFGKKIFETLEKVAEDPIASVRISALRDMAVLMNIDKEKTLRLFLKLTSGTDEYHIYKAAIQCAQYLSHYNFDALMPFFDRGLHIEKVQDQLAIILAIAWLNEKAGSYDLLEKVWKLSDGAKANMVHIATRNYIGAEDKVKSRCEELYKKFLDSESKTIIHQYNTAFLHISPAHFRSFIPLFKKFAESKVAAQEPHYFFEFLAKSSKANPVDVLNLLKHYKKYKEPNNATGPYYSPEDPVKALIGAYNGLYDHSPLNTQYVRKALDLFDGMLRKQLFRSEAQSVLNML